MSKTLIACALALVMLSACAQPPTPRERAAADVIEAQAVAYATAQAVESARLEEKYKAEAAVKEGTQSNWIAALNLIIFSFGVSGAVSVSIFLLSTSAGGSIAVVQIGRALGNKAGVWGQFVATPVDAKSLNPRVIVRKMADGHLLAYDPSVGKMVKMDGRDIPAEHQLASGAITARIMAAVAALAAKAIAEIANNYPRLEE